MNMANVYDDLQENEKALEYHKKALEIFIQVFDYEHTHVAYCLINMANVYNNLQEYQKALDHYQVCFY